MKTYTEVTTTKLVVRRVNQIAPLVCDFLQVGALQVEIQDCGSRGEVLLKLTGTDEVKGYLRRIPELLLFDLQHHNPVTVTRDGYWFVDL